jgi:hypothetical protein
LALLVAAAILLVLLVADGSANASSEGAADDGTFTILAVVLVARDGTEAGSDGTADEGTGGGIRAAAGGEAGEDEGGY